MAALLIGCYPNRVGIYGALTPKEEIGLESGETTIAEVLKSVGYATQIVGKWHLGHLPEFLPTRQGFDDFIGLPYSNDMWPIDYDGTPAKPGKAKAKWPVLPLLHISSGGDLPDTVMKIRNMDDQARLTTLSTAKTEKFIRNHKHSTFFLYLAHSMPHV